jgi:hypothetical protein
MMTHWKQQQLYRRNLLVVSKTLRQRQTIENQDTAKQNNDINWTCCCHPKKEARKYVLRLFSADEEQRAQNSSTAKAECYSEQEGLQECKGRVNALVRSWCCGSASSCDEYCSSLSSLSCWELLSNGMDASWWWKVEAGMSGRVVIFVSFVAG